MLKWVKFLLAILLLPVCAGAAKTLWMVMSHSGGADTTLIPIAAGAACWLVIFLLLPKPMWIYVVGHELTHAVWVWLFDGSVKKLRATAGLLPAVVFPGKVLVLLIGLPVLTAKVGVWTMCQWWYANTEALVCGISGWFLSD